MQDDADLPSPQGSKSQKSYDTSVRDSPTVERSSWWKASLPQSKIGSWGRRGCSYFGPTLYNELPANHVMLVIIIVISFSDQVLTFNQSREIT